MQQNVGAVERVISIAVGTGLVASRWGRPGSRAALATGAGLIVRGALGYCPVNAAVGRDSRADDTRRALGGARGIHVSRAVTIRRSAGELYRFWRELENLPKFMPHLADVRQIDERRSHWVVRGPAGRQLEWDAEIINDVEPSIIAWRSLPGADVVSAGSVTFHERARGGTEVLVHFQYDPPGGAAGRWMATILGQDPDGQVREDLRRLKQLMEAGEVPTTEGQPEGRRTSLFKTAVKVAG